jgi:hypothetical protein
MTQDGLFNTDHCTHITVKLTTEHPEDEIYAIRAVLTDKDSFELHSGTLESCTDLLERYATRLNAIGARSDKK